MARSRTDAVDRETIRRRVLAYVADAVAIVGVVAAARNVEGPIAAARNTADRSLGRRVAAIVATSGVVAVPYHVLLEGATGRTLGKELFRITVVRESGAACTYRAAAVRTAFRVVDWLPVAYLAGLTSMAVTERRQRLGDLAAGTVVVREDEAVAEPGVRATREGTAPWA